MASDDVQPIQDFISHYYPKKVSGNFEELLGAGSPQLCHQLFLMRIERTLSLSPKKLEYLASIEGINTLWAHIINDYAFNIMGYIHKQGWNNYDFALKTEVVMHQKAALLATQLQEPVRRKRKGSSSESSEDEFVDEADKKRRKMGNRLLGEYVVDAETKNGLNDESTEAMDLVSLGIFSGRNIKPIKRRRTLTQLELINDINEIDHMMAELNLGRDLDEMELEG